MLQLMMLKWMWSWASWNRYTLNRKLKCTTISNVSSRSWSLVLGRPTLRKPLAKPSVSSVMWKPIRWNFYGYQLKTFLINFECSSYITLWSISFLSLTKKSKHICFHFILQSISLYSVGERTNFKKQPIWFNSLVLGHKT